MPRASGIHEKRIVVGISGSSGSMLGIRLLETLKKLGFETHLIISETAEKLIEHETKYKVSEVKKLATNGPNPDFDAAKHRAIYVDVDASRYNGSTAGKPQFEQILEWRKLMNAALPRTGQPNSPRCTYSWAITTVMPMVRKV